MPAKRCKRPGATATAALAALMVQALEVEAGLGELADDVRASHLRNSEHVQREVSQMRYTLRKTLACLGLPWIICQ